MEKFDLAAEGLQNTVKETGELEKRANQAGVELIKASDTLRAIREEVKDMERKRTKQERLLRDINQVRNHWSGTLSPDSSCNAIRYEEILIYMVIASEFHSFFPSQVTAKKDAEYKDLDSRIRGATQK